MNMNATRSDMFRAVVQENKILRERLEECQRLINLFSDLETRLAEERARQIEFERELFWSCR
jgi:hypothetical protein